MILRILKKDLRRKKTMNVILTVFVILAATFISSSVNNILAIAGGVDDFFDLAGVPDLLVLTINYSDSDVSETLNSIDEIDRYEIEPVIYVNPDNLLLDGKELQSMTASGFYQPFEQTTLKFFDENDEVITAVEKGTIWVSARHMDMIGVHAGDELEVRFGDMSRKLTVVGGFKDASTIGVRFLVNESDYAPFTDAAGTFQGSLCYITTQDTAAVQDALNQEETNIVFFGDRARIKTGYIMDMVIAGILLVVSVCLILIAFVVLRFTISFTLTEEYREIGVMKAIGIPNLRIRLLYIAKYALISVVGALIGFFGSIPFGEMMLRSVSEAMVLGGKGSLLINALCSTSVVAVTLAFCFGCTGKVKRFTPVDAIRSGKTGERFKKKGILRLSRSPMKPPFFMAANDLLSSPRRFGTIMLTFALCLSLVLILVTSVNTLKSDGLITAFGMIESDLLFNDDLLVSSRNLDRYFSENGRENIRTDLNELEQTLAENGMEACCSTEVAASLTLVHGKNTHKCYVYQGVGTTADQYDYYEGTPPQNAHEIAMTKIVAEKLGAGIGDTVTIRQLEGDREYVITALFQSMMSMGESVRLHESAEMNYQQLTGVYAFQIDFTDDPNKEEVLSRAERIRELFDAEKVQTSGEYVESMVGIADTLNSVRAMVLAVVLIIIALVTVLMEHSFITKERAEIALMKAVGFSNRSLIAWHCLRFGIVALAATLLSLIAMLPLTELTVGPIFTMMGADFGIEYVIKPLEVFVIYPLLVLFVTLASAFFTSLHLGSVKASECSDIE